MIESRCPQLVGDLTLTVRENRLLAMLSNVPILLELSEHERRQLAASIESVAMRKGDVAVVPPWVPHGAKTRDNRCDEVDVFNPPRKTLLEHARAQQQTSGGADDVPVENPV